MGDTVEALHCKSEGCVFNFRRKVMCSIFDGVIGIFHWLNLSGCPVGLSLTQPLREMNIGGIFWGVKVS